MYNDLVHTIGNNNYVLNYDSQNSERQKTVVKFYCNREQEAQNNKTNERIPKPHVRGRRNSGELEGNMAQLSPVEERAQELLSNAINGIQDAHAHVFDASVSFGGDNNKGQYLLTVAHAQSPVSPKSRFLANISAKPFQQSQNAQPFNVSINIIKRITFIPL